MCVGYLFHPSLKLNFIYEDDVSLVKLKKTNSNFMDPSIRETTLLLSV